MNIIVFIAFRTLVFTNIGIALLPTSSKSIYSNDADENTKRVRKQVGSCRSREIDYEIKISDNNHDHNYLPLYLV